MIVLIILATVYFLSTAVAPVLGFVLLPIREKKPK